MNKGQHCIAYHYVEIAISNSPSNICLVYKCFLLSKFFNKCLFSIESNLTAQIWRICSNDADQCVEMNANNSLWVRARVMQINPLHGQWGGMLDKWKALWFIHLIEPS